MTLKEKQEKKICSLDIFPERFNILRKQNNIRSEESDD